MNLDVHGDEPRDLPAPQRGGQPEIVRRFLRVRQRSVALVGGLNEADAAVQSMPDASPAKWHLAHTTWFFETFVLRDHVPGYRLYDEAFPYLYNSYYESEGARHPRAERGMITRPSLAEVLAWRAHVDDAVERAMVRGLGDLDGLVELGIAHEEQHQELLVTDVLDLFSRNPLKPAYGAAEARYDAAAPLTWLERDGGIVAVGAQGDAFAFDCEQPRHDVLLHRHSIASRLVTNAEWLAFMEDGGYRNPRLWLADGWAWCKKEQIEAPLRWAANADGEWQEFSLGGLRPLDPNKPVAHVSYYEADAFAAWTGARLPTEHEWEASAPRLHDAFGQRWQWTQSAFLPYPGFRTPEGAIGEYNGKFMSGQCVLRGSSIVTPRGHSRPSYRNFFYPHQRWQFTGVRLARDA